jgi:8-oxo-dGTP pyrophosphatase MutT (NUDIX family)
MPALISAADIGHQLAILLVDRPVAVLPGPSRRAAVLIALYDRDGAPHLVLTRRSGDLAHHPGQIAFPGGRFEESDADLQATALRETHEEIGIAPDRVRVVGRLHDEHARGSDHIIAPYVGVIDGELDATPDSREIARVLEVPVADLLAADDGLPQHADNDVLLLRYPLLGEDVWGATARILRDFCPLLRQALAD